MSHRVQDGFQGTNLCSIVLKAYIEAENKRLENDELRCFDPREIMIRVEVRGSPFQIKDWSQR